MTLSCSCRPVRVPLQAHHDAGGPIGVPEGRGVPRSGDRASLRHRAGRLLSRGRGDAARSAGIALLGTGGGFSCGLCCFNLQ